MTQPPPPPSAGHPMIGCPGGGQGPGGFRPVRVNLKEHRRSSVIASASGLLRLAGPWPGLAMAPAPAGTEAAARFSDSQAESECH